MLYYQLLAETQLSRSADFKLPHIRLLRLVGEKPCVLSKQEVSLTQADSETKMLSFPVSQEYWDTDGRNILKHVRIVMNSICSI